MNLKGLELFTIVKSDSAMGRDADKLFTEHATALFHANEHALATAKAMREVDAADPVYAASESYRVWTVEHDDDGASVFVNDEVAFRFEVQLMTVVE
jgi:hypothetical protein